MKLDAPDIENFLLNLIFESHDIAGIGTASVHNGQGMLAGNAHRAPSKAFAEAGLFDKPCGRELHLAVLRRILRNSFARRALLG